MKTYSIPEAELEPSNLVDAAKAGEEVIISKDSVPAARLVALDSAKPVRRFGTMKGQIWVAEDFDAPLPAEIIADFENGT